MPTLELHCHSTCSDGQWSAAEVARLALEAGTRLFCLTDHDTYAGHQATATALRGADCCVLRGLELSCREQGRTVHVLLYGIKEGPGMDALAQTLEGIRIERGERLLAICARLRRLGVTLDADAIVIRTHGRVPGRPDVARALVTAGICRTMQEAFARYLRDGGPADVPLRRVGVAEGLALGIAAGAKASLAHPHSLGDVARVENLFGQYRALGLEGIEAHNAGYDRAQSGRWLELARRFDLVPTAGSDFHGGDINPAVARPGVEVDDATAARVCNWLGVSLPSLGQ